jgi:hypothetical protein
MTRNRLITFLAGAAAVPLVALAVAGCGGSDNGCVRGVRGVTNRVRTLRNGRRRERG